MMSLHIPTRLLRIKVNYFELTFDNLMSSFNHLASKSAI